MAYRRTSLALFAGELDEKGAVKVTTFPPGMWASTTKTWDEWGGVGPRFASQQVLDLLIPHFATVQRVLFVFFFRAVCVCERRRGKAADKGWWRGARAGLLSLPESRVGSVFLNVSLFLKQQQTFTRWVNFVLQKQAGGRPVSDLATDFCDGVNLCLLLEVCPLSSFSAAQALMVTYLPINRHSQTRRSPSIATQPTRLRAPRTSTSRSSLSNSALTLRRTA